MARKPPPGEVPGHDADPPPVADVEAAIEKALDALRPRAGGTRGDDRRAQTRPARPRGTKREN